MFDEKQTFYLILIFSSSPYPFHLKKKGFPPKNGGDGGAWER